MSYGKPRDPRKEQQWRRRLRQWQKSGLSVRAFCGLHGLSQANFYAWRREIQQRDAAAEAFLRIFRSIGTFRCAITLPAWINRIVANVFYDMKRRQQRHPAC